MEQWIQDHIGLVAAWTSPVGVLLVLGAVGWIAWSSTRRSWGRTRRLALGLVGLLLLVAGAGGLFLRNGPLQPFIDGLDRFHALKGREVPELEFRLATSDRTMRLSELRGQVVVLNLWATWCAPCVGEMPDLARVDEAYRARGARVVAVSGQDRDELVAFARRREVPELTGSAPGTEWIDTAAFLPFTLILDREGRVSTYHFGARTYEELAAEVEALL